MRVLKFYYSSDWALPRRKHQVKEDWLLRKKFWATTKISLILPANIVNINVDHKGHCGKNQARISFKISYKVKKF